MCTARRRRDFAKIAPLRAATCPCVRGSCVEVEHAPGQCTLLQPSSAVNSRRAIPLRQGLRAVASCRRHAVAAELSWSWSWDVVMCHQGPSSCRRRADLSTCRWASTCGALPHHERVGMVYA
eukprot:632847-Alexandrium_andersonii.AAC.1